MRFRQLIRLFRDALREAWNDNVPRLGASLAYYTLFAIAPILLVATAVAGLAFGAEAVRGHVAAQIDGLVGVEGGRAVQALLQGAARRESGIFAAVVGGITLVLAATGAFLELQTALNTIWRVAPRPGMNVKSFLLDRVRSFGIVVAIGFLLLVSLAVSAALAAFSGWLERQAPSFPWFWSTMHVVLSLGVTTILFAMLYRFLPDLELRWRDVLPGAFVTAVLFAFGKHLIGLYLGHSATASTYGAAGSVIVLLLWVYYSSQILLFGAELTRLLLAGRGVAPPPQDFAVHVEKD